MPPKKAPRMWAMEAAKKVLSGMQEAADEIEVGICRMRGAVNV
jgi:hypothetical protein